MVYAIMWLFITCGAGFPAPLPGAPGCPINRSKKLEVGVTHCPEGKAPRGYPWMSEVAQKPQIHRTKTLVCDAYCYVVAIIGAIKPARYLAATLCSDVNLPSPSPHLLAVSGRSDRALLPRAAGPPDKLTAAPKSVVCSPGLVGLMQAIGRRSPVRGAGAFRYLENAVICRVILLAQLVVSRATSCFDSALFCFLPVCSR